MRTDYPAKVLVAWGAAIGGDLPLRDWLLKNGYPELGVFCSALRNKREARQWLMEKGWGHLMAVITGIEGDVPALHWLERNGFSTLRQVTLAGRGESEAMAWLVQHGHRELAMIAHRMHQVKSQMDDDYKDIHKWPQE